MRLRCLTPTIVAAAVVGCSRPDASATIDSSAATQVDTRAASHDWATDVRTQPPCRPSVVAPGALPALVALRDSMGLLQLPGSLYAREFDQPTTSVWIAADSTQLFAMRTDSVPNFMAGADVTGLLRKLDRARFTSEGRCQLSVAGRLASLERSLFIDARNTDSVFAMTGTVIVRPQRVLTLFGAAPNAAMRDSLIAAFVGLQFP